MLLICMVRKRTKVLTVFLDFCGTWARRAVEDDGLEVESLLVGGSDGVSKSLRRMGFHQIDGTAAKAAAGHPGTVATGQGDGSVYQKVNFLTSDLIVVLHAAVALRKELPHAGAIISGRCCHKGFHAQVFRHNVASARERPGLGKLSKRSIPE